MIRLISIFLIILIFVSHTHAAILGDLNNDGIVNIFDYNILLGDFGKTGTPGFVVSDINSDGKVDIFDFNTLLSNFGKTSPTPTSIIPSPTSPPLSNIIRVNPATTYQTINGWEAVAQAGQNAPPEGSAKFDQYQNTLLDRAVDLGINRIRLETRSLNKTVGADLDIVEVDTALDKVVSPFITKSGGKNNVFVTLTLVGDQLETYKAKLGYQILGVYDHIKSKTSWSPDAFEILEPSNFGWDNGPSVTDAFNQVQIDLRSGGYAPYFVLPSSECGATTAINFLNQMKNGINWPQVRFYFKEFAYHRYCFPSDAELVNVANIGKNEGVATAMLEHIGSDYNDLHKDLKIANVGSWEQFTLAWPGGDDGGAYFPIDETKTDPNLMVMTGSRTKYLRQYFKYVKMGAQRVSTTINNTDDPNSVAFINTDGKYVVVAKLSSFQNFGIDGLPAGTYGIFYTSDTQYNINLVDVTISLGQRFPVVFPQTVPGTGVITIYKK